MRICLPYHPPTHHPPTHPFAQPPAPPCTAGDLERDYNNFELEQSVYSQGPGNFRDVNQNRRCDVLQMPSVYDFNVRQFLTYVQARARL